MNGRSRAQGPATDDVPTSEPSVEPTSDFFAYLAEATGPDDPIFRAASLVADAWAPALDRSYRIGYENGYAAGFYEAEQDMARAWAMAAKPIRDVLKMPARGEPA